MGQIVFNSPTHALLAKELEVLSDSKLSIVDYGCGEGELLHYLPISRIKKYLGLEVNQASIPVARKKWKSYPHFNFEKIDQENFPSLGKNKSVKAVFLVGVWQYLPEEDKAHILKEVSRVLKPGGKLLISCTTDHRIYKWFNLYRILLPVSTVNREDILRRLKQSGFVIQSKFERGLVLTPFFSNIFIFFFDAVDKVFFRTKGELGPVGRSMRKIWAPVIRNEFKLPIDFGYTLFIVASK